MKYVLALGLLAACAADAAAQSVDAFESSTAWRAAPASGVEMRVSSDAGRTGRALRVDFDFRGGGGWAAFRRELALALPENYEISFWLKGDAPRNTLEFKLIDASGENVWWVNRPDFEYAGDWRRVSFRRRHVTFAWGPKGSGDIRDVAAIEFAVTAGTGGKGTIWIDDLHITPREVILPYDATPVITRSNNTWTMDFTRNREYGGIVVEWATRGPARSYDVQTSMDGRTWQTAARVEGSRRSRDYVQLPESESRRLRLVLHSDARAAEIGEVRVMPIEWGTSRNRLYETMAQDAAHGRYPKYLTGTQSYWTVIGENGARREAMMNEEGAVEVGKRSFSIEPFLQLGDTILTWADARVTQSLEDDYLPIPSSAWSVRDIELRSTAWVHNNVLHLRYRVANRSNRLRAGSLVLALRPFQVNPPSQFLNGEGGFAPVRRLHYDGTVVHADSQEVVPLDTPDAWHAYTFDHGDVIERLQSGTPGAVQVNDATGGASGALVYRLHLSPGQSRDIHLAVPFNRTHTLAPPERSFEAARRAWHAELDGFEIQLPASDAPLANSIRSTLAYVLINRDSAAIQPGSRAYERSWIRDGSLTSAALLRLGHTKEVRAFIDWYAPFQYADGKVPCCVDHRGADPVPENDSHGELVYIITEYFRFTKDTAIARRLWPHVDRAVLYMDSLRGSRRTEEFAGTAFYGLLPQSISHEGYSAKPMHSYWDDFFALKGYKDAAWLAMQIGLRDAAGRIARSRDEFQADLMRSLETAMRTHDIDYLPGAAELGDFDATSTTVGVNPAGAQHDLPQAALRNTFDRYWRNFVERRDSAIWDAYTPYEWRVVGTLIRLGEKRRAFEVADWFMGHRRPAEWNHWAEVVAREDRKPRFLGDMPHTWVGSDFIRSVLDMFVYDQGDTLVLAAGIRDRWLENAADTIGIRGIHTAHGQVGYRLHRRDANTIVLRFDATSATPPNGFLVRSPLERPIRRAVADGRTVTSTQDGIRLEMLPRELILSY